MKLITDRTQADVLEGNTRGYYSPCDLDRVETAVAELCTGMEKLDILLILPVFTQWRQLQGIPTREEMERYLQNVRQVAEKMGLAPELPENMEHLDYRAANQIEQALEQTGQKVRSILESFQMSGESFAGEENGI